jgi:hypothetical protein
VEVAKEGNGSTKSTKSEAFAEPVCVGVWPHTPAHPEAGVNERARQGPP